MQIKYKPTIYHLIGFIFLVVTASYSTACANSETTSLLPEELMDIAKSKQCNPINDFYDRPGMVEPPYVYGYTSGEKEDSAVFWCQKPNSTKYTLVTMAHEHDKQTASCTDEITWMNYPGGLSIYSKKDMTLDNFVNIENLGVTVPKGVKMSHNAIYSYYDGVESYFYCHEGKWLVLQRH